MSKSHTRCEDWICRQGGKIQNISIEVNTATIVITELWNLPFINLASMKCYLANVLNVKGWKFTHTKNDPIFAREALICSETKAAYEQVQKKTKTKLIF